MTVTHIKDILEIRSPKIDTEPPALPVSYEVVGYIRESNGDITVLASRREKSLDSAGDAR